LTKALDPLQLGRVNDSMENAKAKTKEEERRKVMGFILSGLEGRHSLRELGQVHRTRITFQAWMNRR